MSLAASSSTTVYRSTSLSSSRRAFTTSRRCFDHYETLGVPRSASKAQIKSHYYQLSKKHHPDVSKDPASPRIFSAASEAYAALIDDRQRRAYDRSLLHRSTTPYTPHHPYSPRAPPASGSRASHAWEYSHRARSAGFRQPPPDYSPRSNSGGVPGGGRHYSPPRERAQPDVLRGARRKEEEAHREMDRIRNSSSLVRALQVMAAIAASLTVMGGMGRIS